MMRTMRASAKWIMGAVAISFVGWLVFDVGMDVGGRGGSTFTDVIARVNGQKIDVQTFYGAVRNAQEQQRAAGSPILTMDDQRDLEDQVLEMIVQQVALQDELERRGIAVTDEEIREAARNQPLPEMLQVPEFQTEGQFDLSKYQRYLQSQQDLGFLLAIEARYREEIPRLKLYERLTSDVYVADSRLWRIFRDQNDSVAADLVTIFPQSAIPDDAVELTENDVEEYYHSHRNDYVRPARAWLSYLVLSRSPDATDSATALERAGSILAELRSGADFADVAMRESADSVSRLEGGDLGEVSRGQHLAEFADAALALRPGQISQPVLTQFGYHIIRLQSKSGDSYHASHILVPIELQGDHLREVESRGDSLDLYAAEQLDASALDATAERLGISVMSAGAVVEGDRLRLDGSIIPDVAIWAFEALEGETSHVIETPQYYYVFRLDRLEPEGVPPLQDVMGTVTFDATISKKWMMAEDLAREMHEDIRSGISLTDAAEARGLRPVSLPSFTRLVPNPALADAPAVVGAAFGLPIGQISRPIESERAIFFVRPTGRQLADSTAFAEDLEPLRDAVLQGARQARVQFVLRAIRQGATVEDLRQELQRAQREQQQDLPVPQTGLGF